MSLTAEQAAILEADIIADPTLSQIPHTADGAFYVAEVYNLLAVPDFWVWRTDVATKEVYEVTTPESTTWSWTTYIQRSAAERDCWREMTSAGVLNMALPATRQGVSDIFSGAGGAAQRAHIQTVGRERASRAEHLFATGPGTPVAPATMTFTGDLRPSDVEQAWAE